MQAALLQRPLLRAALGTLRPAQCRAPVLTLAPTLAPARLARPAVSHITCAYGDLPNIGGGRKWKHYKLNHNGKVVRFKMHVKKGDFVQVISGKDKGKTGHIIRSLPKKGHVIVEGVNIKTRHIRAQVVREAGVLRRIPGRIERKERPVHHSNVMHYDRENQRRSRIRHKILEDGRKVRVLVTSGKEIPDPPYK